MKNGIYQIRNLVNSKIYIGSAAGKGFNNRWNLHLSDLKKNKHHSPKLQNAWNKYGEESFVFETLFYCDPDNCIMYEQIYLDYYKPEYNICKIASSSLGVKRSAITKQRISAARKGKYCGKDNHHFGKTFSLEHRAKLRDAKIGKRLSEEHKAKVKENHACLNGENHGQSKLTLVEVIQIKALLLDGVSQRVIAKHFSMSDVAIHDIKVGKTWRIHNGLS